MGFISKEKIQDYLNAINPCEACSAYGEGAIDVIQHCLIYLDEMPEVDSAKIAKLCNEIEDIACDIARITMNDVIFAESRMIFDKAKDIDAEVSKQPD